MLVIKLVAVARNGHALPFDFRRFRRVSGPPQGLEQPEAETGEPDDWHGDK